MSVKLYRPAGQYNDYTAQPKCCRLHIMTRECKALQVARTTMTDVLRSSFSNDSVQVGSFFGTARRILRSPMEKYTACIRVNRVKAKVTTKQATKVQRSSRGITLLFL